MSDADTPSPEGPTTRDLTQTPAGELPVGWTLLGGQYTIQSLIASGGFGITYLARDTLGRDVAVKECFPLGLAQRDSGTRAVSATSAGTSEHFETARAQFLREARMLAQLQHPNVVHVQTLFEENGTAYMAMDFIHGRDLQEEIVATEAGMSPPRVLELARDLLGALEYVHSQSVLHRDIKPQNIRIDRFGVPLLIDFGAARAETQARSRMAGTFRVVTDGYSPHEFYVSGAAQGPHSDLYALAATLHHVITGAAPVAADERASAIATGQTDPYTPISGHHPSHDSRLLSLIDRALRMTPGDRPESAAVWLAALADAPTTLVTPTSTASAAPAPPPSKRRFVPGLLIGAIIAARAGGAIWAMQPSWLSPGMTEMMERMGQLEESLALAEAARAEAEAELTTLQGNLTQAEENLARLEAADGDMAATMAELDEARAARDLAASQVAELEAELATLAATEEALTEAQAARDAAETRITELSAAGDAAAAQIAALQEELAATEEARRQAQIEVSAAVRALAANERELAALEEVASDLTEAEAALYAATTRAATLEEQLAEAMEGGANIETLRGQLQELESILEATEAERDRLTAEIAAMSSMSDANAGEVEQLRARIATLEAENAALSTALARAEAALGSATDPGTAPGTPDTPWVEHAELRPPNGTFALLPRFSWDMQSIAIVDSTGGISIYDRESGVYRAHLARGIPDPITRVDFSLPGNYLIATTPNGTPNRLFDVENRREVLRFEPTTVTTASRAISRDERWFVYTRAGTSGRIDVVVVGLEGLSSGTVTPSERILTSVPAGSFVRVAFAETSNTIVVVRDTLVELHTPEGRLERTASNRMGQIAALSPVGGDQGFIVLRPNGDVVLFDGPLAQNERASLPARTTYSRFRLSGDRMSFIRANAQVWDVIDMVSGTIAGSGQVGQGYGEAEIALSADGSAILIGSIDGRPARLIDVASGAELQQFGDAAEGYFSFDNAFLVTGTEGNATARIWRNPSAGADVQERAVAPETDAAAACRPMVRTGSARPLGPSSLDAPISFTLSNPATMNLRQCLSDQEAPIASILATAAAPMLGTAEPALSLDLIAGEDAPRRAFLRLETGAARSQGCTLRALVLANGSYRLLTTGSPDNVVAIDYPTGGSAPVDVWLISNRADCSGSVTLWEQR